jgi:hypothetical protein
VPLRSPASRRYASGSQEAPMIITLGPLISLIAGILIFIMPRLLNYIVALYLIIFGVVGLFGPIQLVKF